MHCAAYILRDDIGDRIACLHGHIGSTFSVSRNISARLSAVNCSAFITSAQTLSYTFRWPYIASYYGAIIS